MTAAAPQPRVARADPELSDEAAAARARRIERRRRQLHLRRRRRDLLEDFGVAVLLMIFTLIVTAGIGVIALLEVPVAAVVIGTYVLERRIRSRGRARGRVEQLGPSSTRARTSPGPPSPGRRTARR